MDDLQTFYALAGLETKAGDFSTASWLQNLVRDRQSGLLQHAADVKLVSDDIKDNLYSIASTFETTDKNNADALERSMYHQVNEMKIDAYRSGESVKGIGEPAKPNDGTGQPEAIGTPPVLSEGNGGPARPI